MQHLLDVVNHNSGAISLLFSLVVAGATVFYAVLTHRLVSETRQMRELQTEPALSIWIEPSDHDVNFLNLIIENSGQGPALSVNLKPTPDFQRLKGKYLSQLGLFKHGVRRLAPHQRITFFLTSVLELVHDEGKDLSRFDFSIEANYRGPLGRKYQDIFPIHFESFEGFGTIGTPPLISIARDIERIRTEVGLLASGFRKLQVIVSTRRDVQRDQETILARNQARIGDASGKQLKDS